MTRDALKGEIERLSASDPIDVDAGCAAVEALWQALESGSVRAVERRDGEWFVNRWVKQGIILAFRAGNNVESGQRGGLVFRDRDTLSTWNPNTSDRNVRIVPGGSAVRRGAFLGDGVVMMPPAYVNVGAYVGDDSMIDSHVLVGSCAQIGRGVHLSAGVQIGGVLEPIGALPVVVEDEAFVGGGCGIFEGTRVGKRAVLAPGVILSGSVAIYDLARERILRARDGEPLVVPDEAVVVPGSRPAAGQFAEARQIQLQTPVIVKYRDPGTDAALTLEDALR